MITTETLVAPVLLFPNPLSPIYPVSDTKLQTLDFLTKANILNTNGARDGHLGT